MISVVILTYNRVKDLAEAIASVRASRGPGREIIVVDNGSTDGTAALLASQPDLRVLRFDRGEILSRCRNAGIEAARGEIIAFTDDDCVVAEDWLELIAEDLRDHDAVGGIVKLHGKMKMPWWWNDELNWMPGLSVPGLWGPLAGEIYLPQSANLAYRADILRKMGFSEGLEGIWMKNMTREDSDLWIRTRAAGCRTLVDTRLVVLHKLPPSRFTLSFCLRRAFSDGFAAYHRERGAGRARERLRFIAREPYAIFARARRGDPGSRVHEAFWIVRECGFLFAHLRRARHPVRPADLV